VNSVFGTVIGPIGTAIGKIEPIGTVIRVGPIGNLAIGKIEPIGTVIGKIEPIGNLTFGKFEPFGNPAIGKFEPFGNPVKIGVVRNSSYLVQSVPWLV
jgi:hypothetical protein